ncbi:MAG: hypothetical protein IJA85_11935 [Clostridia bacterium]|nr:hypothetical protein [Clostridia bacterium]
MKIRRFKREMTISLTALLLLFVFLLSACQSGIPAADETETGPADTTGQSKAQTEAPSPESEEITEMIDYPTVTFDDIDFSELDNFKEAPGADSGVKGSIYVLAIQDCWNATGERPLDYDYTKFAVSLQGILNREEPILYLDDGVASMNWFRFLRATTDGLLYGKKTVKLGYFDALIDTFGEEIKKQGIVLWDPALPATSNIATNVCGVEGYLPVMYSEDSYSLCQTLLKKLGDDIVKMDLRGKFTGEEGSKIWDTNLDSSGSAKCDAYLWAMEKYVKTGKTDAAHIAYMTDFYPLSEFGGGSFLDNSVNETYLPSQDYIVQNAIFTFDLAMFGDHPATDDPEQEVGLDYEVLKQLLQYQYDRNNGEFSQCIGFPPFPYKYTDGQGGKYDAVMAEWTTVEVMSAYNIAVVADCPGPSSLANCSVFSRYEQKLEYSQAEKREKALSNLPEYEDDTYYIYIYGGDFDAASWTYHIAANGTWQSEGRGEIPLSWAFNPNLMERIPMVWDVFYATATENDFFIGGDSGAGYVNPMLLRNKNRKHSKLPDGLDAWARWCTGWYKKADLSITGMILDGLNGYADSKVLKAYQTFSPDGIGVWNWPDNDMGVSVVRGTATAVSGMAQDWGFTKYNTAEEAADSILHTISYRRKKRFYPIKTNIIDPSLAAEAVAIAQQKLDAEGEGKKIRVVDPYTFFAMLSRELQK